MNIQYTIKYEFLIMFDIKTLLKPINYLVPLLNLHLC